MSVFRFVRSKIVRVNLAISCFGKVDDVVLIHVLVEHLGDVAELELEFQLLGILVQLRSLWSVRLVGFVGSYPSHHCCVTGCKFCLLLQLLLGGRTFEWVAELCMLL